VKENLVEVGGWCSEIANLRKLWLVHFHCFRLAACGKCHDLFHAQPQSFAALCGEHKVKFAVGDLIKRRYQIDEQMLRLQQVAPSPQIGADIDPKCYNKVNEHG
jgi:hypothetical protein